MVVRSVAWRAAFVVSSHGSVRVTIPPLDKITAVPFGQPLGDVVVEVDVVVTTPWGQAIAPAAYVYRQ